MNKKFKEGQKVKLKKDIHYRVAPSFSDDSEKTHLLDRPVLMMSFEEGREGVVQYVHEHTGAFAVSFLGTPYSIVFSDDEQTEIYLEE